MGESPPPGGEIEGGWPSQALAGLAGLAAAEEDRDAGAVDVLDEVMAGGGDMPIVEAV